MSDPTPLQRALTRIELALRAEPALAGATIDVRGTDSYRVGLLVARGRESSGVELRAGTNGYGYRSHPADEYALVAGVRHLRVGTIGRDRVRYQVSRIHPDKIDGDRVARIVRTIVAALDHEAAKTVAYRERTEREAQANAIATRVRQLLPTTPGRAASVARVVSTSAGYFTLSLTDLTREEVEATVQHLATLQRRAARSE